MPEQPQVAILEGSISVIAALETGSRPIHRIYLRSGKPGRHERIWQRIERLAKEQHVPIKRVADEVIDQLAAGKTHGGVLAEVGDRRLVTPIELLEAAGEVPFIVMLDGIEDPFNFGYAVRALYAAGAHGLVLRPRNWMSAANIVAKASAGATERMPSTVFATADDAAAFFREHGLTVACTSQQHALPLYQADLTKPLFMVIGGEKRGITRSFLPKPICGCKFPTAAASHIPYQPTQPPQF
ncbi:MAG: hypothetical protein GX033_02635 [Firmicutes bacterium]|nr:hypothetical protein [Bacillota bacterium]